MDGCMAECELNIIIIKMKFEEYNKPKSSFSICPRPPLISFNSRVNHFHFLITLPQKEQQQCNGDNELPRKNTTKRADNKHLFFHVTNVSLLHNFRLK